MASDIDFFNRADCAQQSTDSQKTCKFAGRCVTHVKVKSFDLCDEENGEPAYIAFSNSNKKIAMVDNSRKKNLWFYAVDNCLLLPRGHKRCDCLLHDVTDDRVLFIELKNQRDSSWFRDGVEQVKSTLAIFQKYHPNFTAAKLQAFVCNKIRPKMNRQRTGSINQFAKDTGGIRLSDQAKIKLM